MSARRFENIAFCGYTDSAGGSSPGSQGDGAPSYLPMEVEDRTTQILSLMDDEWSRARFGQEWETGEEDILSSSSVSTASRVDTEDEGDTVPEQEGMSVQQVMMGGERLRFYEPFFF